MITVTETAASQIKRVAEQKGWSDAGLRFGLKDGGCSGYAYLIEFEEKADAEDLVHEQHGARVFIHPMHLVFVEGSTIDWKIDPFTSQFEVTNPQAKRFCGCGESFDV